ncbi:unnamed protein product [Closterium sp. Naga37s-1]|nr:unnamed protein product [Closterium sp. Naga37s-1]
MVGRLTASRCYLLVLLALLLAAFRGGSAVRFTLDQFECLTYYVHYVGDEVHGNFVVVSSQTWGEWESLGVDIVVEDPDGYHVHSAQGQTEGVFSFESMREGDYKVCFTNKSPINEEIVFELHVGHHFSEKELAKEEHVEQTRDKAKNLYERVMVLSMHAKFRHSQAQRLNELAKTTTARLIFKTAVQSGALILCSSIQVYLLHRLFERKLGRSFV